MLSLASFHVEWLYSLAFYKLSKQILLGTISYGPEYQGLQSTQPVLENVIGCHDLGLAD